MTNREYLAQNPSEMGDMLRRAREHAEKECGYHNLMIMSEKDIIEKWLNAECEKTQKRTHIASIALVMHDNAVNRDESRQIAEIIVRMLKNDLALRSYGIDDITVGKIQTFEI